MTRPPAAVMLAALLTGLQGVFIILAALAIGFTFLVLSGLGGGHKNLDLFWLGFGSVGLLGGLGIVGATMLWYGSRRWAVVIAVFDVVVLALELWAVAPELLGGSHPSPPSSSVVLGFMMWNLVPLICLLSPSSRRWSGSRPTRGQTTPTT